MSGVYTAQSPFELSGTGPSRPAAAETKFQRFQRLQADVKALLDEISSEVSASHPLRAEEPLPSYVHKELKALHQQLDMALADERTRQVLKPSSGSYSNLSTDAKDLGIDWSGAVRCGVGSLIRVAVARALSSAGTASSPPGASVTYELYAKPSTEHDGLVALERRLAALERTVGSSSDALSLWDQILVICCLPLR